MVGDKKYFHGLWIAVLVLSAVVSAAPTYITDGLMTWQRGVDGSTWQEWTFDTAQNPASPEQFYNPYGNPYIELRDGSAGIPGEESVDFDWVNGVWQGDPIRATAEVPNNPQANPYKTVWFEMVYKAVSKSLPSVSAGKDYEVERTYFSDRVYEGQWRVMTIGWTITPNPALETISFALAGTGGFVTSVSIDTLCAVPAPGAILLASLGTLTVGLIRKRLF